MKCLLNKNYAKFVVLGILGSCNVLQQFKQRDTMVPAKRSQEEALFEPPLKRARLSPAFDEQAGEIINAPLDKFDIVETSTDSPAFMPSELLHRAATWELQEMISCFEDAPEKSYPLPWNKTVYTALGNLLAALKAPYRYVNTEVSAVKVSIPLLCYPVCYGSIPLVEVLLQQGIDPYQTSGTGQNILHYLVCTRTPVTLWLKMFDFLKNRLNVAGFLTQLDRAGKTVLQTIAYEAPSEDHLKVFLEMFGSQISWQDFCMTLQRVVAQQGIPIGIGGHLNQTVRLSKNMKNSKIFETVLVYLWKNYALRGVVLEHLVGGELDFSQTTFMSNNLVWASGFMLPLENGFYPRLLCFVAKISALKLLLSNLESIKEWKGGADKQLLNDKNAQLLWLASQVDTRDMGSLLEDPFVLQALDDPANIYAITDRIGKLYKLGAFRHIYHTYCKPAFYAINDPIYRMYICFITKAAVGETDTLLEDSDFSKKLLLLKPQECLALMHRSAKYLLIRNNLELSLIDFIQLQVALSSLSDQIQWIARVRHEEESEVLWDKDILAKLDSLSLPQINALCERIRGAYEEG